MTITGKGILLAAIIIMIPIGEIFGASSRAQGGILSPSLAAPLPGSVQTSVLMNSQRLFLHPMPPVSGKPLLPFPGIPISIIIEQNLSSSTAVTGLVYSIEIAMNSDNAPTAATALEWVVGTDAILFRTSIAAVSSMETNAWRMRFVGGYVKSGWCAYGGIEGALIYDIPEPFVHASGVMSFSGPIDDERLQWTVQCRMSWEGRREAAFALGISIADVYAEAGWCVSSEGSHAALMACVQLGAPEMGT